MVYKDDPFAHDPFAEKKEERPSAPQPPTPTAEPQPQALTLEEVGARLEEKKLVRTTFGNYVVVTEISQLGRKWCYDAYAMRDGKKVDELILPPEYGASPAEGSENMPPSAFIRRASQMHLTQCERVKQLIEKETRKKERGRRNKIIGRVFALLVLGAIVATGYYLYPRFMAWKQGRSIVRPQDTPIPVDGTIAAPQLRLEYSTIRGRVQADQQGIPTILLKNADVVTVTVIDQKTGKIVAQETINIQLE